MQVNPELKLNNKTYIDGISMDALPAVQTIICVLRISEIYI